MNVLEEGGLLLPGGDFAFGDLRGWAWSSLLLVQYRMLWGDRFLPCTYLIQPSHTNPLGTLVLHFFPFIQTPPGFRQVLQILPLSFSCRSFGDILRNNEHWYSLCLWASIGHGYLRFKSYHFSNLESRTSYLKR